MTKLDLAAHPHKRLNPLTGEWVLVSPHRTKRPWQGQMEATDGDQRPRHDPTCYLCPGNKRANGEINPDYADTFVFDNDYAALLPDTPAGLHSDGELIHAVAEPGRCKVMCFSPRHDLSVPGMAVRDVAGVVGVWADEYKRLADDDDINYVQIFENKGSVMGCSNPHPHCQIWSSANLPVEVEKEQNSQCDYTRRHKRPLLLDYLDKELRSDERIILDNKHFVVLVPFWAAWPFETMILPRRHVQSLAGFGAQETLAFADAYKRLTMAYDRVFACEFPYTAGIHQAPVDGQDHPEWQLHMHFYPPLLRSATVKKFMVGYEMLATPQRDFTPEAAADLIRAALTG